MLHVLLKTPLYGVISRFSVMHENTLIGRNSRQSVLSTVDIYIYLFFA